MKPFPKHDRRLLVVCLLILSVTGTALLTVESPDGDLIDCIDRTAQPAFKNPLLKAHQFQEKPTELPLNADNYGDVTGWQLWHQNGTFCPKGTVPIKRVFSPMNKNMSSNAANRYTQGHEYAIGNMNSQPPQIYGTKARMSVWHPNIQKGSGEFSLGQVWLTSGSYKVGDLNSIEAGWQVYPSFYRDNRPRLFILWTSDAYHNRTCYNLRCPGFIQISQKIALEGAISPASTFGGAQTDLTIHIWKDTKLGLWWLAVGFNNGTTFETVGYWPIELFSRLIDYAETVEWGGEAINQNMYNQHTTTQMGSGFFPDVGFGKAAYMCNLEVATNRTNFQPTYDLHVISTNPAYYRAKKTNDTCFLYGGPEHGSGIRFRFSYVLLYFTFSIFVLI